MAKLIKKEHKLISKLLASVLYQIIGAAICFSLIYGMKSSENPTLNQYASSIGQALRYDADFTGSAKSAAAWLKDKLIPDTEDATFQ